MNLAVHYAKICIDFLLSLLNYDNGLSKEVYFIFRKSEDKIKEKYNNLAHSFYLSCLGYIELRREEIALDCIEKAMEYSLKGFNNNFSKYQKKYDLLSQKVNYLYI